MRVESAAALARHGEASVALPVLTAALRDKSSEVVLHAARALELLGESHAPPTPKCELPWLPPASRRRRGDDISMFIRFSLEAAMAE